jgi:hypothetical protein
MKYFGVHDYIVSTDDKRVLSIHNKWQKSQEETYVLYITNVQHLNILLSVGWRSGQLFHHVPIYHKGKPIKKIFCKPSCGNSSILRIQIRYRFSYSSKTFNAPKQGRK